MDVSLGALRQRLFDLRSWDSTGDTLDNRVREALNLALDRLAGDVPEALIPDEQHVVLRPQVLGTDSDVAARVCVTNDQRLLTITDTAGDALGVSSLTTWRPTVDGTWDGIMHIEFKDEDGQWHRRQCLEFFTDDSAYYVTLDRPYYNALTQNANTGRFEFRLHQPEFFLRDDVMEVLEPARIWDDSRQQVWAIDTAGAYRQDMVDFQGNNRGRPYRMWRGRHFKIPAPTEAPEVEPLLTPAQLTLAVASSGTAAYAKMLWGHGTSANTYRTGKWGICYTYVMGRREREWQQSPAIAPPAVSRAAQDSSFKLTWAHEPYTTLDTGVNSTSGVNDPVWESAPSPVTEISQAVFDAASGVAPALALAASDIGTMQGFGAAGTRQGRSGYRVRYYIAYLGPNDKEIGHPGFGDNTSVESTPRYYFLCEADPTFDQITGAYVTAPSFSTVDRCTYKKGARIVWNGDQLFDYHRALRHSTGYFAWKVFPHQDARYELDFRVLRLPRKYVDNQDTAPIQRDAIPALVELSLYYMCLLDGADEQGAQLHLGRYEELGRKYRERYANPGRVVEPVPLLGYPFRHRYGAFKASE